MAKKANVNIKYPSLPGSTSSRPITPEERRILNIAETIRQRRSHTKEVQRTISGIRGYVLVSQHPSRKKIETLKHWLKETENPRIQTALRRAIKQLEGSKAKSVP